MKETASMAVLIYKFSFESPYEAQNELAWAAALVLVVLILAINITAQVFSKKQIKA
jgi:phosphate transport system permease protein